MVCIALYLSSSWFEKNIFVLFSTKKWDDDPIDMLKFLRELAKNHQPVTPPAGAHAEARVTRAEAIHT